MAQGDGDRHAHGGHPPLELLHVAARLGRVRAAEKVVRGQPGRDGLQGRMGNADVDAPLHAPPMDPHHHHDDHVLGRHQLHRLRVACLPLQARVYGYQVLPCLAKGADGPVEHPAHDRLLDLRQLPQAGRHRPRPAQQPVDDDKAHVGRDLNEPASLQGRKGQHRDKGRIGQRSDELVVRRLAHRQHFALHHSPHIPGQVGGHAPGETFVNNLQRAQLVLGKLVGPPEVIPFHGGRALPTLGQQVPHDAATTRSSQGHWTTRSTKYTSTTAPSGITSLAAVRSFCLSRCSPSLPWMDSIVSWRSTSMMRSRTGAIRSSTRRWVCSESTSRTMPVRMNLAEGLSPATRLTVKVPTSTSGPVPTARSRSAKPPTGRPKDRPINVYTEQAGPAGRRMTSAMRIMAFRTSTRLRANTMHSCLGRRPLPCLPAYSPRSRRSSTMSTRRLRARFSGVSLSTRGRYSPYPAADSRWGPKPCCSMR